MGRVPCPLPNQVCRDTTGSIGSYICECQEGHVMTDVEEEGCKSVAITRIENTVRPHVRVVSAAYDPSPVSLRHHSSLLGNKHENLWTEHWSWLIVLFP